jgi:hypothetical protein
MRFLSFYSLLLAALVLYGCKADNEGLTPDTGLAYFPFSPGITYLYHVDSIIYDRFNQTVDSNQALVRVRYVETFTDSTGKTALRIETDNPKLGFNQPGNRIITSMRIDNNRVVDFTDTGRLVRMVFPVRKGREWNPNMYNNRSEQVAKFDSVGVPFWVDSTLYPETVKVRHLEIKTFLTEISQIEVYAKNIGLVYAENTFIERFDGRVSGKTIVTKLIEKK